MISKLQLKNFKCFESLSLEMSNLNLFTGINSMGKSTAIQAMLLLRQAYEMGAVHDGIYLNGGVVNIGIGQDLLYKGSEDDEIGISLQTDKRSCEWSYQYTSKGNFLRANNAKVKQEDLADINLFAPTFSYLSAERLGPKLTYEKSHHQVYEKNQVGYKGEFFADYLSERGNDEVKNESLKLEGYSKSLLYQMEKWLSIVTPGIIIETENSPEVGAVRVLYGTTTGALVEKLNPLNVGFGLSYTAPIILALLKTRPGDLVILENPEAHLHPKGQRMIGEMIAKAAEGGAQIIVETHSDHLLNGIRLAVRKGSMDSQLIRINYFLTQSQGKGLMHTKVSPVILEDGSLSAWPDGFFDEWDKAIMELF